jgi:hypothetical protein
MNVPTLVQLLALVSFVALALAIVVATRRLGRFAARSRQVDGFRAAIADLARRIGASLDGVAERVDLVRHQSIEATEISDNVVAAIEAVARYADELRGLEPPGAGIAIRDAIATELERAGRALDLVRHGCDILETSRRGTRELEAQTSIKRGYLNLIHAREAVARQALAAEALASPPPFGRTGPT